MTEFCVEQIKAEFFQPYWRFTRQAIPCFWSGCCANLIVTVKQIHKLRPEGYWAHCQFRMYCCRKNFRLRFNLVYFVVLAEGTKFRSMRKPCTSSDACDTILAVRIMGLVRITSWYPNFNGSHFGLPPSEIHRMTGLPPKIVWTMTYSHRPHCSVPKSADPRVRNFYSYGNFCDYSRKQCTELPSSYPTFPLCSGLMKLLLVLLTFSGKHCLPENRQETSMWALNFGFRLHQRKPLFDWRRACLPENLINTNTGFASLLCWKLWRRERELCTLFCTHKQNLFQPSVDLKTNFSSFFHSFFTALLQSMAEHRAKIWLARTVDFHWSAGFLVNTITIIHYVLCTLFAFILWVMMNDFCSKNDWKCYNYCVCQTKPCWLHAWTTCPTHVHSLDLILIIRGWLRTEQVGYPSF